MTHALLSMLDSLAAVALGAGAKILELRDSAARPRAKADFSPVTEADLAADGLIRAALTKDFAGVPVVTEEEEASHGLTSAPRFFLVDPLDGTKEFVKGNADFTVNIGLIERGAPVLGVIFAPARGRLFLGARGIGAFEAAPSGERRPIRAAQADPAGPRIVATRSHPNAETDAFIARHAPKEIVRAGSSLKFCLLAAGEADLYPRFGATMEWDTAAGQAILEAAGGRVAVWPEGAPLAYGKPGALNPDFVAHGPGVCIKSPSPPFP